MNADDLRLLETVGAEVEFEAGCMLIEHGQHGAGLYVIREGTVVVEAPEGTRELGPGAVIGERAPCCPPKARERRASGQRATFACSRSTGSSSSGSAPTMRNSRTASAPVISTSAPTAFPELNELLAELVARVESILDANFVGAYLTGSFALGAGDLHSDCDFLFVMQDQVTGEQERALRELHGEIPTRSGHWPHDLEGSYAPRADVATLAGLDRHWLYVDRGWREMQWGTHCNNEVVRWTLRERGTTLAGLDPREFVAEVPADALRGSMRRLIESFLPGPAPLDKFDNAWSQRYAVTTLCRMLYTLETAEIVSKQDALAWAKHALSLRWRDLIQQALDDRELGWRPDDPPRANSVEATVAFAAYAKERAAR